MAPDTFEELLFRTSARWKDIAEGLEALDGQLNRGKPGDPHELVKVLLDNARKWHSSAVEDWKYFR